MQEEKLNKKKTIVLLVLIISILIIGLLYSQQKKTGEQAKIEMMNNEIIEIENKITDNTNSNEMQNGIIGILEIDKIHLKGLIKEGSSSDILQKYIGHIESSPKYDGNICLAAHNRGNIYSYFAKLNELAENDEIKYKTIFGDSCFSINKITEIDEQDWSLLEDTDENKLTLITCIKNKKNKRLCVQATKKS
ncbi:MAG: class D sortase [Clostridia bacterium]|nr:class D sortase [Clostridia bacterium]